MEQLSLDIEGIATTMLADRQTDRQTDSRKHWKRRWKKQKKH
jgi:hypothetical protein